MRHLRRPAPLLLTALLFLGALGILAASGSVLWPQESRPPARHVPPPPMSFPLYFDRSLSYEDALRAVTDLGLQPSLQCGYEEDVKAGRVITHMQWQPAGQRAFYVSAQRLFVALTPMTPRDWTTRIKQISGLLPYRQEDAYAPHYCPNASIDWGVDPIVAASASPTSLDTSGPAASIVNYAQAASSPTARIIFAPSTTYDEALYAISDLGLRLADPCYERAQSASYPTPAPWPGAGHEQRFAATHDLIVAAAPLVTPINWDQRVRSLIGVSNVAVPYTASC